MTSLELKVTNLRDLSNNFAKIKITLNSGISQTFFTRHCIHPKVIWYQKFELQIVRIALLLGYMLLTRRFGLITGDNLKKLAWVLIDKEVPVDIDQNNPEFIQKEGIWVRVSH